MPALDHRGLDLAAARRVRYARAEVPLRVLRAGGVCDNGGSSCRPPVTNQYRLAHRLEVTRARARRRVRRDAAGNVVASLEAERVPQAIEFRLAAVLERVADDGPTVLAAEALRSPRLLRPTPLTAADDRLRAMAADIAPDPRPARTRRRPPTRSAQRSPGRSFTDTASPR